MQQNQDTDRTQAIYLKHLSPTWVKSLDEEVGKRGMFCDLTAIFRGLGRPITFLKEELRLVRRTNN
jgi:hypothetical protein